MEEVGDSVDCVSILLLRVSLPQTVPITSLNVEPLQHLCLVYLYRYL